jgi:hypothetical protein
MSSAVDMKTRQTGEVKYVNPFSSLVLISISFYAVNMDEYTASHRLSFLQPQKKWKRRSFICIPTCSLCRHINFVFLINILFFLFADRMDLWFSYRRYPYRIQDACSWLEINLLHAEASCL